MEIAEWLVFVGFGLFLVALGLATFLPKPERCVLRIWKFSDGRYEADFSFCNRFIIKLVGGTEKEIIDWAKNTAKDEPLKIVRRNYKAA